MRNLEKLTELWHGEGPNLNAGCGMSGTCIRKPFINFDIKRYPSWDTKPHVLFEVGDVRKLPYPDNYFDVIFSSELIEHFSRSESVGVLKEFYRTLKKGGVLKVICPDFEWAVNIYLGKVEYKDYDMSGGLLAKKDGVVHGNMGPIWSVAYGYQGHDEKGMPISEHQTLWDEESLRYYLNQIGFKNIERVGDKLPWSYPHANARDLPIEAWKE